MFQRRPLVFALAGLVITKYALGQAPQDPPLSFRRPPTPTQLLNEPTVESQSSLEADVLDGDAPEWLESIGYSDNVTNDGSGPLTPIDEGATSGDRTSGNSSVRADSVQKCLLCRDKLTGDWLGYRSGLQKSGLSYRGRVTQYFFGVGGGVDEPFPPQLAQFGIAGGDRYEYTGNSQHDFLLDLDKFGGLPHSKFLVTMENIWGRWGNVSFETGAFAPPVFNATFPVDPEAHGVPRCTNFMLIQPLSEKFIMTIGKTRTIGVADNNKFAGGDGSDQFINQQFVANPLMVPMIPLSTFVIGTVMPREWGNIGLSVMDPLERSTEFGDFGSLFSEGVLVFGQVKVNTEFFNMPGEQHVGGFYKKEDQLDLRFTTQPPLYPEPPAPPGTPSFLTRPETYTLFYGFDQYLVTYGQPNAKGISEGWGVFGRASIADGASGNPNWGAWHLSGGIGGDSPLCSRRGKGDRIGLAYGYTGASNEFGAIPQFLFGPRDAQAIEAFYRYQVTPAVEFTPDIQWVRGMLSGLTNGDDALVFGARLNMKL